jgi:predicted glycogen debranching enzyme
MIRFERDVCGNLEKALPREWLETNGSGGFASSTIVGLNTRRYHGLLVAATQPPVGRYVLLSKLEETLLLDGRAFELSANHYPSVVYPRGFRYLKEFRLDPFPVFTYEVEGTEIEKTVFMVQGENTTIIQYRLINGSDVISASKELSSRTIELELRPLIAFRDYHSLTRENAALNSTVETLPGRASIAPYAGLPSLHLAHNAEQVESGGASWYRNFQYEAERERGLDFTEDLFNPCILRFDLRKGTGAAVIASTEPREAGNADEYRRSEISRRLSIVAQAPIKDEFVQTLTAAADQFIVARGNQTTIIAGYHWFSDWGRDTMIALPGLTLATGRYDLARSILRNMARHVDRGMLPNRFPDSGENPEYNTVDATLWFFEAVRSYLAYTDDLDFVDQELYGVLTEIVSWHVGGTRFGVKVDSDGLLNSGEPGIQLTWMDAKVGDWLVTPRHGKPLEVQALWYNALRIMQDLALRLGDEVNNRRYQAMATLAISSFNRLFWNEEIGCLYDVVNSTARDASIRPNQIFAISLPYTILNPERAQSVLGVVQQHLLTPYGLRTLATSDPQYRGRYSGDQSSRDGAYHQGTVWTWLMGPFLTAYIKVRGRNELARRRAESWLLEMKNHLSASGLGQISEIFDGDDPHRPLGCIAQAWSVAELLRATVEDVHGLRPQSQISAMPERYPSEGGKSLNDENKIARRNGDQGIKPEVDPVASERIERSKYV